MSQRGSLLRRCCRWSKTTSKSSHQLLATSPKTSVLGSLDAYSKAPHRIPRHHRIQVLSALYPLNLVSRGASRQLPPSISNLQLHQEVGHRTPSIVHRWLAVDDLASAFYVSASTRYSTSVLRLDRLCGGFCSVHP